ncbi:tRNA-guanine transglycosylase, partial [Halobium palmae]
MSDQRVIIDTDTAGDDTQAILMSVLSDRLTVEGLTIVAGNVAFEREVENAKYTLGLVDAADDVPVYEGARSPLLKEYDHAEYVHGEGGLGGDLFPETGVPSADDHAVDYIVDAARENPGELSLLCIGPLTNVALALQREPDLNDLLDEVWVMGGAVNCPGNVTPAAEYNFWVDPDAAKIVLRKLDVHVVDWGLCLDASVVPGDDFERIRGYDTPLSEFFLELAEPVLEFTRDEQGVDGATSPDTLAAACGCDLFDSAAYALMARDGRYLTVRGTEHFEELDYFPCSCPVCTDHAPDDLRGMDQRRREDLLSEHNLHVSFAEIRRIRQAIRSGNLLELVEVRARGHPAMLDGYRALLDHADDLEAQDPVSKGAFFYASHESARRPEVVRHR